MQKVRRHSEELRLFVGTWFQVLFHSPLGVLFTFPSRYLFTIGQQVVLSLGGWSPLLPPGFLVSEGTLDHHWPPSTFAYGGFTLCAAPFQVLLLAVDVPLLWVRNPAPETWNGLGSSAFARRYLRSLS